DGTWDRPDGRAVTNVVKLMRTIPKADTAGIVQLAHYEIGIATEYTGWISFWLGALSVGVGARVQGAYRFLWEHYAPGAETFLFGFSRGAYEARNLAALVGLVGLARRDGRDRAGEAWRCYRRHWSKPQHKRVLRLREASHFPVPVKLVGVWETVGN